MNVSNEKGIAQIVFDSPPVNAIGAIMMRELNEVLVALRDEPDTRVIVFSSANPEFFLAHVEMHVMEHREILRELKASGPVGQNVFQALSELIRHQPQVTIVKLAGMARGGGAELIAAADMTFAALETGRLGQPESLMGILPAAGGTQYLRDRVGRNRALEIVLTGELYEATTAAAYGWINRAVPAAELDAYVDRVAEGIAALPDEVVRWAKGILPPDDFSDGLRREHEAWAQLVRLPASRKLVSEALELGAQTPAGERDLEGLLRSIQQRPKHADVGRAGTGVNG